MQTGCREFITSDLITSFEGVLPEGHASACSLTSDGLSFFCDLNGVLGRDAVGLHFSCLDQVGSVLI